MKCKTRDIYDFETADDINIHDDSAVCVVSSGDTVLECTNCVCVF